MWCQSSTDYIICSVAINSNVQLVYLEITSGLQADAIGQTATNHAHLLIAQGPLFHKPHLILCSP